MIYQSLVVQKVVDKVTQEVLSHLKLSVTFDYENA